MAKEVTFTFRPRNENLYHWKEFIALCKKNDWPVSNVLNSILPTLNIAIKTQPVRNVIDLGRQIKIQ